MILDLGNLHRKYFLEFNGVLHIGAHSGQEFNVYKSLGIDTIIFIEPQPNIFNELKNNVGDSAVCIQTAIGNYTGEIEMWTNEDDQTGSSSVLEPYLHKQQYPHIQFTKKITVPITKIDMLDIPQTNFINIDVQGYELEAFKGAEKYLNGVDYIMSEINKEDVYLGCAKVDEIDAFLGNYGFERVETEWAGGNWGDAFYVKKK